MFKAIYILVLYVSVGFSSDKIYVKTYFNNKKLKSEGWLDNNKKVDYWFFYYENGKKKEEGHFLNNQKTAWWTFYNATSDVSKKCEFKNDRMEGFCIIYKNGNIVRAEKFINGKKIKQWESLAEFKKDNLISSL